MAFVPIFHNMFNMFNKNPKFSILFFNSPQFFRFIKFPILTIFLEDS